MSQDKLIFEVDPSKAEAGSRRVVKAFTDIQKASKGMTEDVVKKALRMADAMRTLSEVKAVPSGVINSIVRLNQAFQGFRGPTPASITNVRNLLNVLSKAVVPNAKLATNLYSLSIALTGLRGPRAADIAGLNGLFAALKKAPTGVSVALSKISTELKEVTRSANDAASAMTRVFYSAGRFSGQSKTVRFVAPTLSEGSSKQNYVGNQGLAIRGLKADLLGLGGLLLSTQHAFNAFMGILATRVILDRAQDMQKMDVSLKVASGSTRSYAENLQFLNRMTSQYGVDLLTTGRNLSQFLAAVQGTNFSTEDAKQIFQGITVAARGMNLSIDDTEGTYRALTQIMSKGKLQAEELRGQLGDRLPGAFSMMAEALGVTTGELDKLMKKGLITGDVLRDGLLKFSENYAKKVAPELDSATNTISAGLARLNTSFSKLVADFTESGFAGLVGSTASGLAKMMDTIRDSGSLKTFGFVLKEIGQNLDLIVTVSSSFFALWSVAKIGALISAAGGLSAAMGGLLAAGAAMLANPLFLVGAAAVAAVAGVTIWALMNRDAQNLKDTMDKIAGKANSLRELRIGFSSGKQTPTAVDVSNAGTDLDKAQKQLKDYNSQLMLTNVSIGLLKESEEDKRKSLLKNREELQKQITETKRVILEAGTLVMTTEELTGAYDKQTGKAKTLLETEEGLSKSKVKSIGIQEEYLHKLQERLDKSTDSITQLRMEIDGVSGVSDAVKIATAQREKENLEVERSIELQKLEAIARKAAPKDLQKIQERMQKVNETYNQLITNKETEKQLLQIKRLEKGFDDLFGGMKEALKDFFKDFYSGTASLSSLLGSLKAEFLNTLSATTADNAYGAIKSLVSGKSDSFSLGNPMGFSSDTSSFINDIGTSFGFSSGLEAARPAANFIGPMPQAAGSAFGSTTLSQGLGIAGSAIGLGQSIFSFADSPSIGGGLGMLGAGAGLLGTLGVINPAIGAIAAIALPLIGGLFGDEERRKQDLEQARLTNEKEAATQAFNAQMKALSATTEWEKSVASITQQFDEARKSAAQYGLSIEQIDKAQADLIQKARDNFELSIDNRIKELKGDPSGSLDSLKKSQEERYNEALAAEIDLAKVRELNALELKQFYEQLSVEQKKMLGENLSLVERIQIKMAEMIDSLNTGMDNLISITLDALSESKALAETYKSLAVSLRDTVADLRTGTLTTLNPASVLGELRTRFDTLQGQALQGNTSALQALPQVANSLLEASRGYYASSTDYAAEFDRVTAALSAAGIKSDQFGGAQDYKTSLLESQLTILEQIKESLAKESPDAVLLKQQIEAMGIIGDLIVETNSLNAAQIQQLAEGNAIQDILTRLTQNNNQTSQSIITAIQNSGSESASTSERMASAMLEMKASLASYLSYMIQRDAAAAEAAKKAAEDAARQAQIDSLVQGASRTGTNLQASLASVADVSSTENQHSWMVGTNIASGNIVSSNSGDRGDPVYDRPRAEHAANAITEVLKVVMGQVGLTGAPNPQFEIAQKYGSSASLGGVRFATSLNDYEGMTAFLVQQMLVQGSGGNDALKQYAKTLNWYNLPVAIRDLERKAIDLGLRGFAEGTSSAPPGLAWVGERGPELVNFKGGEKVFTNSQSRAIVSGNSSGGDVVGELRQLRQTLVNENSSLKEEVRAVKNENAQLSATMKRISARMSAGGVR